MASYSSSVVLLMKTAAIVLAAGKSERMGQNKLLLRLNDTTVIDHILDAVAAANINETVVVLGHKPERIIEVIQPRREVVKTVINEDFERGMISSFQKGLQLLPPVDASFLILGDELILDNNFLNAMIQHMENSRGRALLVSPIHKGKKGHPLLVYKQLSMKYWIWKKPKQCGTLSIGMLTGRSPSRHRSGPSWT
jgi:molybdenum cofactor cytidylyltransferase